MVSGRSNKGFDTTMFGCKVCMHPQRSEIEAAVYMGQNHTDIADHISIGSEIPINRQNIHRHKKYHMPDDPPQEIAEGVIDTGGLQKRKTGEELTNMFDEVDDLIEQMQNAETIDFRELNDKAKTLVQLYNLKSKLINQNKDIIQDVVVKEHTQKTQDFAAVLHAMREEVKKKKKK